KDRDDLRRTFRRHTATPLGFEPVVQPSAGTVPCTQRPYLQQELALKRCLDVVGAGLLLIVLAPGFLVVAIAIKLSSPGPV
ncbi:hypothetical protein CH340_26090, partial [Rhodoplanes serenus]